MAESGLGSEEESGSESGSSPTLSTTTCSCLNTNSCSMSSATFNDVVANTGSFLPSPTASLSSGEATGEATGEAAGEASGEASDEASDEASPAAMSASDHVCGTESGAGSGSEPVGDERQTKLEATRLQLEKLSMMELEREGPRLRRGLGFAETSAGAARAGAGGVSGAAARRHRWRFGEFLAPQDYLGLEWILAGEGPVVEPAAAQTPAPAPAPAQTPDVVREVTVACDEPSRSRRPIIKGRRSRQSFQDLFKALDAFARSSEEQTVLGAMSHQERRCVNHIAKACQVRVTTKGSGKRSLLWLSRTVRTTPVTPAKRRALFDTYASGDDNNDGSGGSQSRESTPRGRKLSRGRRNPRLASRVMVTTPIPPSNIGHRMLRSLGWDGGQLGSSQVANGLLEPVPVFLKNDRQGLGFASPEPSPASAASPASAPAPGSQRGRGRDRKPPY
ncbi:uncharacterized protein AMSG_02557 [Thecamonas trahens ATCC 50062]|uniref:G-patch domain-containing protein n=1 Tax=Thecamonas trahens ATCC 50062 TaxID=461836 RepID=A0A0L0D5Q1_THETB|nr:hypothetical protein AMSG_02557 [Thecamonas trahens ATCC 50062]KNC47535.1 hypothetical protein AMSG_02557 [Thecamonas trahens ATCC 50062]|eukprot:XP_013759467.1 hypothetical protein AMSG_02557 [Thecamonas trahens ATCC 50062]